MNNLSVAQIRAQGQKVHKGDWTADIVRHFSAYLTWAALRLRISANAVSLLNIGVSISVAACLVGQTQGTWLLAIPLLLLGSVLDSVDGEVARCTETQSLTGLFLDRINSLFLYPLVLFSIGIGQSEDGHLLPIVVGFVASWSIATLRGIKSAIDSTAVDALSNPKASTGSRISATRNEEEQEGFGTDLIRSRPGLHYKIVDAVLVRQSVFALLLGAAIILEASAFRVFEVEGWRGDGFLMIFLAIYGTLAPIAIVVGIRAIVVERKVESQVDHLRSVVR